MTTIMTAQGMSERQNAPTSISVPSSTGIMKSSQIYDTANTANKTQSIPLTVNKVYRIFAGFKTCMDTLSS